MMMKFSQPMNQQLPPPQAIHQLAPSTENPGSAILQPSGWHLEVAHGASGHAWRACALIAVQCAAELPLGCAAGPRRAGGLSSRRARVAGRAGGWLGVAKDWLTTGTKEEHIFSFLHFWGR